ncbi:MAG: hypothetical protein ACE5R6_12540 [Candidatus Heimdallarchaeota archaeon]
MSSADKVRKKRKWGKSFEYTSHSRQLNLDSGNQDTVENDIVKMRAITPSTIANRYDIRVSTAKQLLQDMSRRGKLRLIINTRRLKVYEPVE